MNKAILKTFSIFSGRRILLCCALVLLGAALPGWAAAIRGRLANPGFINQRIKATYFFTGQALDGSNFYGANPPPACNAPNCCSAPDGCKEQHCPNRTYTLHPANDLHLRWSESIENQRFALDTMVQAGINVIHMSCWGDDTGTSSAWTDGAAPMQTSPQSHDELFSAADPALGRPLLIVPCLEERGGSVPWSFKNEFPIRPDGLVAPGTISQIEDLIHRYLQNPQHPEWSNRWARIYGLNGQERFAVGIIHAASNRLGPNDDAAFALGFDAIANQISNDTHVAVGFLLDALPTGTHAEATFYPSSGGTGPALAATKSVLGIACFVPEVYLGLSNNATILNWKRGWSQGWAQSNVPFLMDVSSGYDGRVVFCESWFYGEDATWLCGLDQMVRDFGQSGIIFNSWNGYTEGMVALPTVEQGTLYYDWLRSLLAADVYAQKPDAPAPRQGTWCSPYTLSEAIQNVPSGGSIGLFPTTTLPFDAPPTITRPCTINALGGSAKIGN